MRKKKTKIKDSIPTGHSFEVTFNNEEVNAELVRIAFKAILGGLVGINRILDEKMRRTFTIRFLAAIIGEANAAVHNAQMANRLTAQSPDKVVENLLKSLHKKKD